MSEGGWSDFETIVLHEIMKLEDQDYLKVYNDIVFYSKSNFCVVPLDDTVVFREKTHKQIVSKLFFMTN